MHSAKDVPGRAARGTRDRRRCPRARTRATRSSARRRSRRCRRARGSGPRACAAARSCWRSAPTSRSCRCAATSTRACASSSEGECDAVAAGACRPAPPGQGARGRRGARRRRRSCRRPARGCWRSRRAADDARRASCSRAIADPVARARLDAERAVVEALDASCHTPVGAHAARRGRAHRGARLRRAAGRQEWITDRLDGRGVRSRAAPGPRWRAGCWPPARASCCAGRQVRSAHERHDPGTVYLVGAGPGDPGLATVRAVELIAARRRDPLRPPRARRACSTARARRRARLRRQGGRAVTPMTQEEINRLLVEHASDGPHGRAPEGRRSVRVRPRRRGGGGARRRRRAASRSCPGVTAGVAAPAYAGIPVTHRDQASAVAFVTAHEDPAKDESALDWAALAAFPGTLVFYMGVRALPQVAARCIAHGRAADEPAAVVERGTLPGQRTVTGTLERDRGARARGRHQAAGGDGRRAGGGARASGSPGSSGRRCTGAAWRSPARGRRRAGSRRACRSWAPRSSRCPRSGSCRASSRDGVRDGRRRAGQRSTTTCCA